VESSKLTQILSCRACGAAVTLAPRSTPRQAWLAVAPCQSCRSYAAYMVTDGGARTWVVRRTFGG
jgi:hypothetical protein